MTTETLIREYLPTVKFMQLSTCVNNQPWACTLAFYSDEKLDLYWISNKTRRHSEEIKRNNKVSATFLVQEASADKPYIIGISVEGIAEELEDLPGEILKAYQKKIPENSAFVEAVLSGGTPNKLYKLIPKSFVLMDTKNFKDDPRQEWTL